MRRNSSIWLTFGVGGWIVRGGFRKTRGLAAGRIGQFPERRLIETYPRCRAALLASRFRNAPAYQKTLAAAAYQSPFSAAATSNIKTIVPACSASSMSIQVGQIIHRKTHCATLVWPSVAPPAFALPKI